MSTRKASIKETGEELGQEDWERFDRAVEKEEAERPKSEPYERGAAEHEPAAEAPRPGQSHRPAPARPKG